MSPLLRTKSYLAPYTIAQDLDVDDAKVRKWIEAGEMEEVRIDGFRRVPIESYQAFLRRKIVTERMTKAAAHPNLQADMEAGGDEVAA